MYIDLVYFLVAQIVLLTRSPDISFFKDKALAIVVDQSPLANVKFALFVKQWFFNVLLDNELEAF